MAAAVDIFRFQDYRAYLRAFYEARKKTRGGFSLRAFSAKVGLRSPNYLKLVMDGDRNLTSPMALRFAEACDLPGEARDYFCALVAFNQAETAAERDLHYARMRSFRSYRKVHVLDAAHEAYHSAWYIPAIRELTRHAHFQDDAKWIAGTLLPPITVPQAEKAIEVLLSLKLLARDAQGKLVQVDELLDTGAGPLSHHVVNFHRTMMTHAAEAIDRVPRDEREIASLTLCLSREKAQALKAELSAFRRSVLERYAADERSDRVVQLNIQMFPLSTDKE